MVQKTSDAKFPRLRYIESTVLPKSGRWNVTQVYAVKVVDIRRIMIRSTSIAVGFVGLASVAASLEVLASA